MLQEAGKVSEELRGIQVSASYHVPKTKAGASLGLSFPLTEEGDYLNYLVSMNLGDKGKVTSHVPDAEFARAFQQTHPAFREPPAP